MDGDDHLERLLHEAAQLDAEPTADVPRLVRRGRWAQRRRRALRAGGIAAVVLVVGVAVSAADSEDPEVSTIDAPDDGYERQEGDRPEPSIANEVQVIEEPTTVTSDDGYEDVGPTTTSTTSPPDPGPLRLTVSPSTIAPYGTLLVRSEDPCPPGSIIAEVYAWAIGGTTDGQIVGGGPERVDAEGHWSTEFGVAAIGGIEHVAWARTAPELEVRSYCAAGRVRTADYESVSVHHGHVEVVPELTATWDGLTATIEYSGCPNAYLAHLSVGDAPPPPGSSFAPPAASARATPGTAPDSWIATIELPGYDTAEGLWATAFCQERSNVTSVWRYLPFELDPPG